MSVVPDEAETLAARWRALQPRLVRLARGVVGSTAVAEDVVQTAWLRLRTQDGPVRDLEAWGPTAEARGGVEGAVVDVDGRPGLLVRTAGVVSVLRVDVDGGLVRAIDVQRDPAKAPADPTLRRLLGA